MFDDHDQKHRGSQDDLQVCIAPPFVGFTRDAVSFAGRTYLWSVRAKRRNKLKLEEAGQQSLHRHHSKTFVLFSWQRILETVQNPVDALSFSVGPVFLVGSLLFVFGCAAQTHRGYWVGDWSTRMEDNLVNIPFLVGAAMFLVGCYAAVIEAANIHYADEWRDWQASPTTTPQPTIQLHPRPSAQTSVLVSYYGTLIQFIGSVLFLIGAITELIGANYDISDAATTWFLDVPFLLGGCGFVVGAYLLVSEGAHSWWRGLVPPLREKEFKSVDYWVGKLNWWGSIMFLGGGIEGFVSEYLSVTGMQLLNSFTWLLGSVLFSIQGLVLYLETINQS